ncbi:MAG: hypothetical protein HQL24_07340 [Candidatus Omnitrophica bacterium]|nr:hypothetical protein [Candidatus Omnitrophota bacterium]
MDINTFLLAVKPEYFIIIGLLGIILCVGSLLVILYKYVRWALSLLSQNKKSFPGIVRAFYGMVGILLTAAICGLVMFVGLFFTVYHNFYYEKPVAEVIVTPTTKKQISQIKLIEINNGKKKFVGDYFIQGNQWMLEGDILKLKSWIQAMGLHNRYRLTRLRGRYLNAQDEVKNTASVYSLEEERHNLFWRYLYRYGQRFPWISSVYGSAVFQNADTVNHFFVYIGTSGFTVKEN